MRVPWQHFQVSLFFGCFWSCPVWWHGLSEQLCPSCHEGLWCDRFPQGSAGRPSCSLCTQRFWECDYGAEDCGFHRVLMTSALYISPSLDPLRSAKQFIWWLMKMEMPIKAYLSRSGWGNACRRKQRLHSCLAEDAVFAPPSLSIILLCFPHSFFLCFLFYFLHLGCILELTFCIIGQSIVNSCAINSEIVMLDLHVTVIWPETKYGFLYNKGSGESYRKA